MILVLCSFGCVHAQNLVINPGLTWNSENEQIFLDADTSVSIDGRVKAWNCPFKTKALIRSGSTDGHVEGNRSKAVLLQIGAPAADDPNYHKHDYITYLQGTFKAPLVAGQEYQLLVRIKSLNSTSHDPVIWYTGYVESDTSHINRLVDCNGLGIRLLGSPQRSTLDINDQSAQRQFTEAFYCDKIISTNQDWTWFRMKFRADINATHFLLGNYAPKEMMQYSLSDEERAIHFIRSKNKNIIEERIARYLVDSVVVEAVTEHDFDVEYCQGNSIAEGLQKYLSIDFETNQAHLDSASINKLRKFAEGVDSFDHVEIIGYADARYVSEYNLDLSAQRVGAVVSFLFEHTAVDSSSVVSIPLGERYASKIGALNSRKVELFLSKRNDLPVVKKSKDIYQSRSDYVSDEMASINGVYQYGEGFRSISDFTQFDVEAVSAVDEILTKSEHYDIIFIGEHHLFPSHRIFVHSLLDSLYSKGYTHLFLEALSPNVQMNILNKINYPNINLGFYIREPHFGSLVKKALDLGVNLHAYEYKANQLEKARSDIQHVFLGSCSSKGWFLEPDGTKYTLEEGETRFSLRSYLQAFNIAKQLPSIDGKVIIYAGETHNRNFVDGCLTSTSYWLNRLTDKSILNIGQSVSEAAPALMEEPFVLKNDDQFFGSLIKNNEYSGKEVMMEVYYPSEITLDKMRRRLLDARAYTIEIPQFIDTDAYCLIYRKGEDYSQAVPVFTGFVPAKDGCKIYLEHDDYVGFCLYDRSVYPVKVE